MNALRGCYFVAFVACGVMIVGCSSSSNGGGDDDVGSPGGAFTPPHSDGGAGDAESLPEDGGEAHDGATPHDAGVADASTVHDARPPDAQSGGLDSGVHDAAPTGCMSEPLAPDAGRFHPTLPTVVPQAGNDGGAAGCGPGDLTAFFDSCFGANATQSACDVWTPGGTGDVEEQTCGACIYGLSPGGGPLVFDLPSEPHLASTNDVACILAADPSSAGMTCAQDLLDLKACMAASCSSCTSDGMGGGTDPDGTLIGACETAAEQGACAAYAASADADCDDTNDGGAAAVCNLPSGTSFETTFFAYAGLLCGGS